ncbi:Transcription factor IIIA [Tulasnella sp. 418]|nr:Transcription factor IIIA [Tulasnella sp. 418]
MYPLISDTASYQDSHPSPVSSSGVLSVTSNMTAPMSSPDMYLGLQQPASTSSATTPSPAMSSLSIPPQKGRRTWKCKECGKIFVRKSACSQHFLSHTGEKPHLCAICQKGFGSKSNLKRHRNTKKCLLAAQRQARGA